MTQVSEWQKWCRSFDALHDNILDLFHSRRIWRTIRTMIETNPDIQRSGIAEHWLIRCYTTSQLSAIRRQVDRDQRTASLRRSLDRLLQKPDMASRAWFMGQLRSRGTNPRHLASLAAMFDAFADPGADSVNPQRVSQDRDRLVAAASTAKTIVDKVVAHHEYQAGTAVPAITWGEFDGAIDMIGSLYKKYYQLRHPGCVLGNLTPDLPAGWDGIFATAWKPRGFTPEPSA